MIKKISFQDHHNYSTNDIEKITQILNKKNIDSIVTTRKDYVKIKDRLGGYNIYIVDVHTNENQNIEKKDIERMSQQK